MPAYETKDNSGTMFVNDRKASDKHPDRTGSAVIDGTEYWVSGWLKTSKDGKPYLSLAFKPKDTDTKPKDGGLSGSRKPVQTFDDPDVPF
jgi:hypothetical protein